MTNHITQEQPEFKREDRYLVLKRKDLAELPSRLRAELNQLLKTADAYLPPRQYVVVESDWPEYETVFNMIEARVTGTSKPGELPPLPEQVSARVWIGPHWVDGNEMQYVYSEDGDGEPLFTADQLQAYGQQCAEQMKERAIAVCDKQWTGTQCAAAIKELK